MLTPLWLNGLTALSENVAFWGPETLFAFQSHFTPMAIRLINGPSKKILYFFKAERFIMHFHFSFL
jgi:hypothetical protein